MSSWISTLARWLLGGVLIAAGAIKMVNLADSAAGVRAYQLLPDAMAGAVGWTIPFFSILLGLVLLAGAVTRIAAIVSAVLMILFLAVVASAAARGLSVDCGCFGGGGEVAPGQAEYGIEVIRTLGLLACAGWLIVRPRSRFSFDRAVPEEDPADDPDRETSLIGGRR
ncbi:MauE/DoxX family redox-associated membrane protein [Microlunatus sp. GCM10028923]|uniref:MauE/DoxX family redox-associated membrane protein n=1 Tax=Microlunatus sp. GCM10028923 TaxID=3273400 RepID=UPI0036134674